VSTRTPEPDARVRLFGEPQSHTPTHSLSAGSTARPITACADASFDVYTTIVQDAETVTDPSGSYTAEWDDRGGVVRAEAVLQVLADPAGEMLMMLRLTADAVTVQRRRYVRVGLRCPIQLFRPDETEPFCEGWTSDLSEGGMRCQINGPLPWAGVPVVVRVTLPEHKSPLLIAGHVLRVDPEHRAVLVEFPYEHPLADTLRAAVFTLQQRRARTL
jgi:hypothetical protein